MSGAGATWTNSGDLYIGRNGTGTLNIASGGTVSNAVGRVGGCDGCSTSAVGTVTVSGAGTTWTNSAGLAIGASGTGQVTIAGGGKVLTGPSGGFLGVLAGATGTMTVTDPGSAWNISDQLTVGGAGSGMMIVQNGGTVTNAAGTIGFSSGSIGAVSVTGTGSAWTSSGNVTVGLAGTGTLTVAGGGAVNVGGGTGTVVVANQAGSIGTLNIGAAPGNTAVAPGTLNAAAVQFGAGTGTLTFNHTSSGYVFAPTITGPGAVNVFAGTTIFTANNAYTGGTTINGGTLSISSDASLGAPSGGLAFGGGALQTTATFTTARPVTLNAGGGTFIPNVGTTLTLAGAVGGVGGLTMAGGGTLVLAGASSYSGGTTVNAGTLQLGLGASLFAGGALTVNGGIFNLNGNTQTVGALSGTGGTIALGAGTLTTNSSANTTLATQITGTGGLTKQGLGTLNLTGTNTYTGPTSVMAGTLAVNGSLTSNVAVGAAGTLGGNGTITGLVTNNGIIAPGNSIGTLTINGNFVQSAGSVYQVQVNPAGQSDRINTSGMATINGGMVQVQAQSGTYARNTTYTILNATGGVSGAYSSVTSNFAFLTPSLSYDANNVYLLLFQNQSAFAAGAQTPNQYAVGTVLDRVNATATGDLNNVLNALSLLSNTQGPAALNAISGQPYADFGTMNVNNATLFMNALGQQMANARGASEHRSAPGAGAGLRDRDLRCRGPIERLGQCAGWSRQRARRHQCQHAHLQLRRRRGRHRLSIGSALRRRPGRRLHARHAVGEHLHGTGLERLDKRRGLWLVHAIRLLPRCAGRLRLFQQPVAAPDPDPRPAAEDRQRLDRRQPVPRPDRGRLQGRRLRACSASITPFGRFQISSVTQNAFSRVGRAVAQPQRGAADYQLAAHHHRRRSRKFHRPWQRAQARHRGPARLAARVRRHRPADYGRVRRCTRQ